VDRTGTRSSSSWRRSDVHGTHGLDRAAVDRHATDYLRTLEALRDGTFDLEAVREWPRLNRDLETAIRSR
jgi:hypothetical protein